MSFDGQLGYLKNHFCETALQYVCSYWRKHINQCYLVVTVLVNFYCVFETVDCDRLLNKLKRYGVYCVDHARLEDYLYNRYHKVRINAAVSDIISDDIFVLHESILCPLLFLVYIRFCIVLNVEKLNIRLVTTHCIWQHKIINS